MSVAQSRWDSLTLAAKCALARLVVCLPSAVSEYKYFCETLGTADRALVRSVACCDSYWFMILHLWEAESAFCALCAISVLPRVFLSVSSVEQNILRFAQDDSVDKAQDDSEAVSLTCYSKCHRCHVERSETSFTPFRPLSFRPNTFHCHFDRAAHCHFDRAFPSCHFDRAERVEKSVCYARHRCRNIRSPTTTAQALRGARPQRALLAHGCCLLVVYYVHVPARRVEKSYGNGVLGHEMFQTRPSGVDFIPKMHVCCTACAWIDRNSSKLYRLWKRGVLPGDL